jgi:superfamily II DNA or RNA helicase
MKLVDFFCKFPSAKSTYSNRIFIEEIWLKMYGERGLDYLDNEVAFKDFENKARRIDFVVKTKTGEYAIEVDDFQTHAGASPKKQSEDELKKNSLREKYKDKFITITKYDIEYDRSRAKNTLSRAFIADPDLNRNSGEKIEPHDIQIETLTLLKKTRAEGKKKGLVCYATGLGKTYLSAFDAKEINGKTLFVVHRDEILTKAEESFRRVWSEIEKDTGFFNAEKKETNKKVIFASIQTLYKKNNLELFKPNEFDYIILDETHHAADSNITYKNVLSYFKPKFLLGLTATPERADEFDILKNFYDNNLIIEIDQKQAIDGGYLVPVNCSFLYDNVDYTKIRWNNRKYNEDDLNKFLIIPKRDKLILEEFKKLLPAPKKH